MSTEYSSNAAGPRHFLRIINKYNIPQKKAPNTLSWDDLVTSGSRRHVFTQRLQRCRQHGKFAQRCCIQSSCCIMQTVHDLLLFLFWNLSVSLNVWLIAFSSLQVLVEEGASSRTIILNRPNVLNALLTPMVFFFLGSHFFIVIVLNYWHSNYSSFLDLWMNSLRSYSWDLGVLNFVLNCSFSFPCIHFLYFRCNCVWTFEFTGAFIERTKLILWKIFFFHYSLAHIHVCDAFLSLINISLLFIFYDY